MARILCVDARGCPAALLRHALEPLGHEVVESSSLAAGISLLRAEPFDLLLADLETAKGEGQPIPAALAAAGLDTPTILLVPHTAPVGDMAIPGDPVLDVLTKPLRRESARLAVTGALEVMRLRRENEARRRDLERLQRPRRIVGRSPALQAVIAVIAQVAPTRTTVLLEGESGSGKELFARALHEKSPRAGRAFVTINCAALPEGLVESTFFGHAKGAFTGASHKLLGAFQQAHNGTLFLDEVSEIRLDLQAKLLRAIQEQEITPVGAEGPVAVDVRIVAATNRDLRLEVEAGRFREDLYYRLSVMPIRIPPLRERPEDIALLAEYFTARIARELGIRPPEVAQDAVEWLRSQDWPGNVRELENAVARAVILSRGRRLTAATLRSSIIPHPYLPRRAEEGEARVSNGHSAGPRTVGETGAYASGPLDLRLLERIAIERALSTTMGHRRKAADLLGISERTLRNKLKAMREHPPTAG